MILPSSIPNKKLIAIEQVLKQCQLGRNLSIFIFYLNTKYDIDSFIERSPMACEEIVDEFNDLRSDIVLLFDLKNALNSAEYELQTSLHRLKNENTSANMTNSSTQSLNSSCHLSPNDNSRTVK